MPGVLFLPDLGYDDRIWADIPVGLDLDLDLDPGSGADVIVAAGWAAGRAVQAALDGRAAGLILFQPAPDYLPPEARSDVRIKDALETAAPYAVLIDARQESDPARRAELMAGTWRDIYAGHLAAPDVELACQVIADHADEVLDIVAQAVAAATTGAPAPQPEPPWVDRLAELSVPVTIMMNRQASPVGRALVNRIPAGRFVAADADTDLVWLEDRAGARAAITDLLARLAS